MTPNKWSVPPPLLHRSFAIDSDPFLLSNSTPYNLIRNIFQKFIEIWIDTPCKKNGRVIWL